MTKCHTPQLPFNGQALNEVSRACFIIYVHCDTSDQPSTPKMPALSKAHGSTSYGHTLIGGARVYNLGGLNGEGAKRRSRGEALSFATGGSV